MQSERKRIYGEKNTILIPTDGGFDGELMNRNAMFFVGWSTEVKYEGLPFGNIDPCGFYKWPFGFGGGGMTRVKKGGFVN